MYDPIMRFYFKNITHVSVRFTYVRKGSGYYLQNRFIVNQAVIQPALTQLYVA
jgi:hypothetical protein